MAFEVIPFCRIVKFSGITRFLYQFWKILPKYCGRKEKDHNILWSKWYSRWESNPERPLRRGLLYPFNYGSILNFIARGRNHCRKKFYTKIYTSFFPPRENKHKSSGFARKTCVLGNILWIEQYLRRGLLYPFNYGSMNFMRRKGIARRKAAKGSRPRPRPNENRPHPRPHESRPRPRPNISRPHSLSKYPYFTTFARKRQPFLRGKFCGQVL